MKAIRRLPAVRRRLDVAKADNRGLTIIEVMIVLAIAGIILLIVFEAVPSLQRGSRNSLRKQDVQTILQAVSRYELNDSGKFPDDCGGGGHTACIQAGGSTPNDYLLRFDAKRLAFYNDKNANDVIVRNQAPSTAPTNVPLPNKNVNKVYVYNYALCQKNGGNTTYFGAGYSDVVATYAIETGGGGFASECQQL